MQIGACGRTQSLLHLKKLNGKTPGTPQPGITTQITYQNVSGARSKVHKFNDILCLGTFDILAISETHFDNSVSDTEIVGGTGYAVIRSDRRESASTCTKGGGVCCILRNHYQFIVPFHCDDFVLEHLIVRILIGKSWVIVAIIYLPPGRARRRMVNEFSTLMSKLRRAHPAEECIVVGDFNWPMATWMYDEESPGHLTNTFTGNAELNKFCKIYATNGLMQRNSFLNANGRILDLVLSSFDCVVSSGCQVIGIDRSTNHHEPINVRLDLSENVQEDEITSKKNIRLYGTSMAFRNSELQRILPVDIYTAAQGIGEPLLNSINQTISLMSDIQSKCTRKNEKRVMPSQASHPWTQNREYIQAYKHKLWARTRDRAYGTVETARALKMAYQSLYSIYNEKKARYYARIVAEDCTDMRRFFSVMRTKRKPVTNLPRLMTLNGKFFVGDSRVSAMAENMAKVFSERNSIIAKCQRVAHVQLRDIYMKSFDISKAYRWANFHITFTCEEIDRALMSIKPSKDPGPMGLSAKMLQYNHEIVVPLLFDIINSVVQSGFVPEEWLVSFITPIPKAGDSSDIANYRGIAQQSVIPKILDKLLTSRLVKFYDEFLPNEQHGFRKNRGTTSNLLEITQFIKRGVSERRQTDVIYFDFSKAFDTVPHVQLARKLAMTGMPFFLYRIVMTFISHKQMRVKINGTVTNHEFGVSCGVPQGSHMGPVLFIIYTADMVQAISVQDTRSLMYADDTKIYAFVDNEFERRALQQGIDELVNWSVKNGLMLNQSKTKWITYGSRPTSFKSYYYIGNDRLERETCVRDLGVLFDAKLSFQRHHQYVNERCSKAYGAAYRFALDLGSRRMLLVIFNIYIRPILEYAAVIWTGKSITRDGKLEETLRKATRYALAAPHRPNQVGYMTYENRLLQLEQLSLRTRRTIALVITIEKIRTGKLLVTFRNDVLESYLQFPRSNRLCLRYNINNNRKLFVRDSPIYDAMIETNSLRYQFGTTDSIETIKRKLKAFYIERRGDT